MVVLLLSSSAASISVCTASSVNELVSRIVPFTEPSLAALRRRVALLDGWGSQEVRKSEMRFGGRVHVRPTWGEH